MSDTELQIGQQSEAARFLHSRAQPLQDTLSDLGTALQADFDGFRGGAAAETVKAVEAWFTAAGQLFETLQEYAENLVEVDETELVTENATQQRFVQLESRLGGQ